MRTVKIKVLNLTARNFSDFVSGAVQYVGSCSAIYSLGDTLTVSIIAVAGSGRSICRGHNPLIAFTVIGEGPGSVALQVTIFVETRYSSILTARDYWAAGRLAATPV